jgi:hypothetical protein
VVLNFAQEGMKQPHIFQALNYFYAIGQEFDVVMVMNGFNELYYARRSRQSDWSFVAPTIDQTLPLFHILNESATNVFNADGFYDLLSLKEDKNYYQYKRDSTKSAFLYFIYSAFLLRAESAFVKAYDQFTPKKPKLQSHEVFIDGGPRIPDEDEDSEFGYAVRTWERTALASRSLVEGLLGGVFIQALVPSLYAQPGKFTEKEVKSWPKESPGGAVRDGYPELSAAVKRIQKQNVKFVDFSKIYNGIKENPFCDIYSHLTYKGNMSLAEEFAVQIVYYLKQRDIRNAK